jgi:hypothetical protein
MRSKIRKRVLDATLKKGRSKILNVSVPNYTKSVTIVVQGKERSLYALGSFKIYQRYSMMNRTSIIEVIHFNFGLFLRSYPIFFP